MQATSVRFAAAARVLGRAARRRGLDVPGFRSPPRLAGVERSLRRTSSGTATVAVRLKGRPWPAVLADMIDGVVAANRLAGAEADRARTALWAAVEADALTAQAVGASRARHRPVGGPAATAGSAGGRSAGSEAPPAVEPAAREPEGDGGTVRRFPARLAGPPQPARRAPGRRPEAPRRTDRPLRPVPDTDVA